MSGGRRMKVSDEWCAYGQGVCEGGGSECQSRVCVCANFSGSVTHSLGAQGNILPILLLPRVQDRVLHSCQGAIRWGGPLLCSANSVGFPQAPAQRALQVKHRKEDVCVASSLSSYTCTLGFSRHSLKARPRAHSPHSSPQTGLSASLHALHK